MYSVLIRKVTAMVATICPNCGLANVEGRTICKSCRSPLAPSQQLTNATQSTSVVLPTPISGSGYEYIAVPFVGNITSGIFTVQNAGIITKQLQTTINEYVSKGWDYYSMEKVNVQVTPGCLASLLGQREVFITFDQIIFRRKQP